MSEAADVSRSPAEGDREGRHAPEDSELLRRYADHGSEEAFAELVRRRIRLVYSVALRQTRGDRHRAEDATQAVFTDLARKAGALARRPVLAGWLYRSAQFAAAGLIRAEQRRHVREQEADTMEKILAPEGPVPDWDRVRPLLDCALNEIGERDRDAILLRFFDNRTFAEIGARLRLNEGAARMRVERALDKLNAALARRGIASTTAALGLALGQQVGAALPAGLASTVTGTALATAAAGAGGWLTAFMALNKLQIGIACAVGVAGATGYAVQAKTNAGLRREIAALHESQQAVAALRAENRQLARVAAEVEQLRADDVELKRLAQETADAQKTNRENARRRDLALRKEQGVQAEIDRMNREGNALVNDYKALIAQAKNAATPEERAQAEAASKSKMVAIAAKQKEIQAFMAANRGPSSADAGQWSAGSGPISRNAESASPAASAGGTSSPGAEPALASPESARGQFRAAASEFVELSLPNADLLTLFSAYEAIARTKIMRDPSLGTVNGTVDLNLQSLPREVALQKLRHALRDQLNVVVETTADGRIVARRGPPHSPASP